MHVTHRCARVPRGNSCKIVAPPIHPRQRQTWFRIGILSRHVIVNGLLWVWNERREHFQNRQDQPSTSHPSQGRRPHHVTVTQQSARRAAAGASPKLAFSWDEGNRSKWPAVKWLQQGAVRCPGQLIPLHDIRLHLSVRFFQKP